ncbi:hypothetical protein D7030_00920 [Flavobacteriaceae bacterium AU392]|nr:hypothetical protein D1817_03005 [Flavobacteriaceae bacterium]RKM86620.1 hypothetical protein D7030_00920 [Flavobacteriaceae bacterium AU392]
MKLQKILTIVAAIVGVLAIIFLVRIVGAGDDAIEAAAENGDTSLINPFMLIAYVVLGITLAAVVLFSLINIVSNTASLKSTLIGVGAFALIALICYFGFAKGVETPLRDGGILTVGQSQLIGAGLYMFYALAIIAGGAMLFTGVKKMIK